MSLSWNEIKTRAVAFTNEWKDETSEDAEAKSFWDDFFHVFGISRCRVATLKFTKSASDISPPCALNPDFNFISKNIK